MKQIDYDKYPCFDNVLGYILFDIKLEHPLEVNKHKTYIEFEYKFKSLKLVNPRIMSIINQDQNSVNNTPI